MAWIDEIKKALKANPGKSVADIIPIAKKSYAESKSKMASGVETVAKALPIVKKRSKKTAKKTAKKGAKKSAKKGAKKSAKKSAKKGAKKGAKKSTGTRKRKSKGKGKGKKGGNCGCNNTPAALP